MFKNYLKVAARNLLKYKGYSFINVFGLAVGLACCGVIMLYIQKEASYDKYHNDIEQLYRVAVMKDATGIKQGQASASYELAEVLLEEYPEVLDAARLYRAQQTPVIRIDDQLFSEERFYFADSTIFSLFTIPFIKGEPEKALAQPNSIVVSKSIAEKYFRSLDVVGKVVTVNLNARNIDFKITGVVADAPEITHFKYDVLASFDNVEQTAVNFSLLTSWFNYAFWTYIKLPDGYPAAQFESKLAQVVKKYFPPTRQESQLFLQPVRDIHLTSHLQGEIEGNNNIIYIYVFLAIALLVLVMACINFVNLTTARSLARAREVGMRKVLGAYRLQLIKQFLAESTLVSALAVVFAAGLIELFLAVFNQLSTIRLQLSFFNNGWWTIGFVLLGLMAGLLSGIYPAFFLSTFQPSKSLKGVFAKTSSGARMRKGLVVFQMAMTVVLLIAIATISQQLHFIRDKNLGFQKEQMLLIRAPGARWAQLYDSFKDQLLQISEVKGVTRNSGIMGQGYPIRSIFFKEIVESNKIALPYIFAGHDFAKVYGLEMIEGRDFSKLFSTDTNFVYLVNESAVKKYELQPAVGKFIASGDLNPRRGQIIGVVKDFHFAPLHQQIEPLIIGLFSGPMQFISVRLTSDNLSQTIGRIEKIWAQFEPERAMEFSFLDDQLDQAYRFESQLGKIAAYFTGLAIFIACMGLFGLASFAAAQRTKEIGIRKTLGASVGGVILLLSKDFTKMVLLGFLIAAPVAYFAINRWLDDFAYRIELGPGVFLLAGGLALSIAWLTVSYQSIKAALANPVEALRYE
jgi:putative ABC transport system permease protein